MRRPLVAGNWKMHGTQQSVAELVAGLQQSSNAEVVVFPPYVFISQVAAALADSEIALGAQNISDQDSGAFTGEISGTMLKEAGCQYSLVGHSERRSLYGETNQRVAEKFVAAQRAGLIPVLCVGETLAQREQNETLQVISAQIQAVVDLAGLDAVCSAIVAYEPVWAIGTGMTASPEQAQEVHRAIRNQLGNSGSETRILYGGSVKAANAAELFSQPDIDGALVGGASLDASEFGAICQAA